MQEHKKSLTQRRKDAKKSAIWFAIALLRECSSQMPVNLKNSKKSDGFAVLEVFVVQKAGTEFRFLISSIWV
jgi:hypothetical protein